MTTRLPEKQDWYNLRDDRTRRVDGTIGFENFSLGVIIESDIEFVAMQLMALTTLNILSRWCRKIKIDQPAKATCRLPYKNGGCFNDVLRQLVFSADPYGEFSFGPVWEEDFDQIIILGDAHRKFKRSHVRIDGSGWIAGISYGYPPVSLRGDDANIIGPAFAACLGVAELFRQAIGLPEPSPYSTIYSLYDFSRSEDITHLKNPQNPMSSDFGRIYQVGCGAVGSSLDFLLSLTGWTGIIHLIDYDQADITNCNRSLLFSWDDAVTGKNKVDVCAEILKSTQFSPAAFKGSYNDFIKAGKYLDTPPDLILCLANEDQVWSTLQNNYPPIILHATTTPNWGLNFGRHIPKKEWCILCRFSKEMERIFLPQCSEGVIPNNKREETIQGVLPFLSPAGAILILTEMAKMLMDNYPVNNDFLEFSFRSPSSRFINLQRGPDPKCLCHEQSIELYPEQIRNSAFWRFTQS
jgi:hypothetical protein